MHRPFRDEFESALANAPLKEQQPVAAVAQWLLPSRKIWSLTSWQRNLKARQATAGETVATMIVVRDVRHLR
jgi:hypothetical protein